MKSKKMKITKISAHSITHPEKTYTVEVDDPEINKFMITDIDFDLVCRTS